MPFHDPAILPFVSTFLFVFAVVFGLLTIAKGKEEKPLFKTNVNAVIALVFAAFSAIYEPLVTALQQFIPIAAALLLVLFFFVFLKRLVGAKKEGKPDMLPFVLTIGLFLLVLGIFWESIGFSVLGLSSSNVLWLIGIAIVILIFYGVYKHTPEVPRPA